MRSYRLKEAASLLGVSDDTVRRWADRGRFPTSRDDTGHLVVEGLELVRIVQEISDLPDSMSPAAATSARNRMFGLVTRVVRDTVMAQVEIQAGPFRLVSLMSREAADELGLEPGVRAVATVKATQVSVDVP